MKRLLTTASAAWSQARSYVTDTRTPLPLILDLLRLNHQPYCARSRTGLRLFLTPGSGERFAFFENLVREDYFQNGATLRPADTVVDVGANVGCFALLAAQRVGPRGRVLAIEPDPQTFAKLTRNIRINEASQVTPVHAAVVGSVGSVTLHRGANSLFASVCPGQERRDTLSSDVITPGTTLAHLLDEHGIATVDLLKIDCEGAEHEIFESMDEPTARRIRQISMEVHSAPGRSFEAFSQRLATLGFAVRWSEPAYAFRPGSSPAS